MVGLNTNVRFVESERISIETVTAGGIYLKHFDGETFMFDGYYYAVVKSRDSKYCRIVCDKGYIPVMNIKTQQFRGLSELAIVYPVEVTATIDKPQM